MTRSDKPMLSAIHLRALRRIQSPLERQSTTIRQHRNLIAVIQSRTTSQLDTSVDNPQT